MSCSRAGKTGLACTSAPLDLETIGADTFPLHRSTTSASSHFGVPQYRSHAIRNPGMRTTQLCSSSGDGGFLDPVLTAPIQPAPAKPASLQEPSALAGQVIA